MRIVAFPRDSNPYQSRLYAEMVLLGDEVRYVGELTGSQTANILLLPLELIWMRTLGYRAMHLHWVYRFRLPVFGGARVTRRLMRAWFGIVLRACHCLGIKIVWVAHNVLPHEQVFDDDVAGRRTLLRAADAIVTHDRFVLHELAKLSTLPLRQRVARLPAFDVSPRKMDLDSTQPLRVLFFGRVERYKGVDNLIRAAGSVRVPVHLTVSGPCSDEELAETLRDLAAAAGATVSIDLRRLTDAQLESSLAECHLVVLPFTQITTSSSVLYAMSAGRPVLIPDLPSLRMLPSDTVLRFDSRRDPVAAIADAIELNAKFPRLLEDIGVAAREWATAYDWAALAVDVRSILYARDSLGPL